MTRATSSLSRWLLLSTFTVGCGEVFFAELELPEICVTYADQPMIPAPILHHGTVQRSETYELGDQLPDLVGGAADLEAKVLGVTLGVKEGDFGFLDEGTIQLDPPEGSSLPPLQLASYVKDPSQPAPRTLELAPPANDVVPYLREGAFRFTITLTGTVPTQSWKMDTRVCAYARSKVRYLEALQQAQ